MVSLVSVYGTSGGDFHVDQAVDNCCDVNHWWHQQSAWWTYMRGLGFVPLRRDREFVWSGDLDGLGGVWRVFKPWTWLQRRKPPEHRDWFAAGYSLMNYLDPFDDNENFYAVIAHSHGGQAALYAAAQGARIPLLITVATPHRSDMVSVTERALKNINTWIHVYDRDYDKIGQAGQLGDGSLSTSRRQPKATWNVPLRSIDHSLLLRDSSRFHIWPETILPMSTALVANLTLPASPIQLT